MMHLMLQVKDGANSNYFIYCCAASSIIVHHDDILY